MDGPRRDSINLKYVCQGCLNLTTDFSRQVLFFESMQKNPYENMLALSSLSTQPIADICAEMKADSRRSYMTAQGVQGYRLATPIVVVEPGDNSPRLKIFDINPSYERSDRRGAAVVFGQQSKDTLNQFVSGLLQELFPGFNHSLPCQANDYGVQCRLRFDNECLQNENVRVMLDEATSLTTPVKSVTKLPSVSTAKAIVTELAFWGNTHAKTAGCTAIVHSALLFDRDDAIDVDPETLATLQATSESSMLRTNAWPEMGLPALCKLGDNITARIFVNEGDQVSLKSSDPRLIEIGERLDSLLSSASGAPAGSSYMPLISTNAYGKQIRLKAYGSTITIDDGSDTWQTDVKDLSGQSVTLQAANVVQVRQWQRAATDASESNHGASLVMKALVATPLGAAAGGHPVTPLPRIYDDTLCDCATFDATTLGLVSKQRDGNNPLLYFTYGEAASEAHAEFRLVPAHENVELKNFECPERFRTEGKIPGVYIVPKKPELLAMLQALDAAARTYVQQHSQEILGWELSEVELNMAWNPLVNEDQRTCKLKIPGASTGVYNTDGTMVDPNTIPKQSQTNAVFMPYVYLNGDFSGSRKRLTMAGVQLSASVIRLDDEADHNVYAPGQSVEICPGLTVTVAPPKKRAKKEA